MEIIPKVTCRSKSIEIIHIHTNIFKSQVQSNPYLKCMLKKLPGIQVQVFLKIIVLKSLRSFSHFAPKTLEEKLKKSFM